LNMKKNVLLSSSPMKTIIFLKNSKWRKNSMWRIICKYFLDDFAPQPLNETFLF
jgi:hypothetical protein